MATNKFLAKLQEIQKREGNKRCIDCNAPNPQWASVPFGILFCLECSGKHRSLGVHISFVRSITMDKWSEQQVKKMDLGGNKKALAFFQESPEYSENMSIEEKYSSQFAQNYREKLAAECEGKTWTPPPVSSAPSSSVSGKSTPTTPKKSGFGPSSPGFQRTASSGSNAARSSSAPSSRKIRGNELASPKTAGSPQQPSPPRSKNEEYFARLGEANDSRSETLPPNQGGKYTGFGNTPAPEPTSAAAVPDIGDLLVDPVGALSKGWSLFTLGASSALGQAAESARNINTSVLRPATEHLTENVIRPASETVRDPEFHGRVSGYVSSLSRTVQESGSKGFSFLSEYLQTPTSPRNNSSPSYDRVNDVDQDRDGWGYGDEENDDYASFGNSNSNDFKPFKDEDHAEDNEEESEDAWKSTDLPVSGASSSTRYGSSALASKRGDKGSTLQRKGRNNKPQSNDDWGGDEDEWSKF